MGLNIICVGIGGFIGAISRYIISINISKIPLSIPIGTLIVNIFGGLFIGIIMEINEYTPISPRLKAFLTTGIMGGFTTFSTFSYETITLFSGSNYTVGFLNIILNVSLSLLGVVLGKLLVKTIFNIIW